MSEVKKVVDSHNAYVKAKWRGLERLTPEEETRFRAELERSAKVFDEMVKGRPLVVPPAVPFSNPDLPIYSAIALGTHEIMGAKGPEKVPLVVQPSKRIHISRVGREYDNVTRALCFAVPINAQAAEGLLHYDNSHVLERLELSTNAVPTRANLEMVEAFGLIVDDVSLYAAQTQPAHSAAE